ncbi:MAG: GGDEF domain-containing protein [Rhodopseudomonas sp.]|uniref:GGDEF domain-containing protein n=1 Tax=Rhodopseudomonas sp. TaxID=1078 RepID=UPI00181B30BC|nr:sensor domain-containing diguanylate cyclase [Rhodopseudomonas sp.]NVN85325.1 GGDEF domain-containing protein [Rhodopseudomonas sp.]
MEPAASLNWLRHALGRRWQLSARLLVASSVVTVLGFSAVCGSIMLDSRKSSEELARQTMENLAATIDSDISRNVEIYDLTLRGVVNNLALPEVASVGKTIQHLILFDHAITAKHFGAIQVFDAEGNLTLDAATLTPMPINRTDEEFFSAHRDDPDVGLFISRPMLHQGAYSIVLSRRVTGPDGRFLGVVAGSIRFNYFHDLFGRLRLGKDDVIAVIARDGTLIMRTPFDLDLIGKNMAHIASVHQVLSQQRGWFSGNGIRDRIPRMYVWSDGSRPLVVLVGRPWAEILSVWRKEAIRIGSILLALTVFVAVVTMVFIREIARRARAERRLEELATTDALTGLTNRRKFDAAFDTEWRRALRQGTPVAMMMIDADHFKSYNDTFGHQAGDQMLVGIAVCIADSVHRAGESVARYGGEEFAALLPGLTAAAALALAETIRLKVEAWSEGHGGVTISVGVASITPTLALEPAALLEAADKALYAAKRNGRNQSVVAASRNDLSLVA